MKDETENNKNGRIEQLNTQLKTLDRLSTIVTTLCGGAVSITATLLLVPPVTVLLLLNVLTLLVVVALLLERMVL